MEKKHATVIVLTFVLVGLMFFSVDTPLANQQDVKPTFHEAPEIIEQLADEPVPQEPLQMNVIPNPSFETWITDDKFPEDWIIAATGRANSSREYTGSPKHGSYAGFVEAQGSNATYASTYLRNNPDESVSRAYLKYGVSLSLDWYTIANPDLLQWGLVYIQVQVQNTTGSSQVMYYYLSHLAGSWGNDTSNAYFLLNDTIGSWHTFDRNITADFIAAFGSSLMSDTHYVDLFNFYVSSPGQATGLVQVVCDDVSMYNSSFSNWILNGDFESGIGSYWTTYQKRNMGYVGKSIDNTDGAYSLNMSIPATLDGRGSIQASRYFIATNAYFAFGPGMNTISWDWKYHDVVGGNPTQWAYVQFNFYNGTNYFLEFYMGRGDDTMEGNSSTTTRIALPGFGTRDSWVHSEFDLYDLMQEIGWNDLRLANIRFEAYHLASGIGDKVELLIDNFIMKTDPLANPSFEYLDSTGYYEPFQGWWRYSGKGGEVTPSTTSHTGSYSANITVAPSGAGTADGLYRSDINFEFDPALFIDFWWRLEDIQGTDGTCAWIDLEFENHLGGNSFLRYIVGRSSSYAVANTTSAKWIDADGFNETGTWTLLSRNITADIEEAFSVSADNWKLYQAMTFIYADTGMRTSLLIDDFNYKDAMPPTVDSVSFDASPMYYEDVLVRLTTNDVRPGVSNVFVLYTTDGWSSADVAVGVYDEGDWYNATIPAHAYNTQLDFYIQVTDGCGVEVIDDNDGLMYSCSFGDDIAPTLTITNPTNNTDQTGLLAITADVDDPGSGIEYVRFNPDGFGPVTDYTAPYSQNWNLDDESLGSHFIVVTVRDNVGNEVTKTHYLTVVDTVDPVLDSPDDIEFTFGETGYIIDWNPTDIRPTTYEIFVEEVSTYTGAWNSSSEHLVVELDGLTVGTHNYTCVVYDEAGLSAFDTVMVTVNEVVTTSTTPTTTTETTDTTITTDTTSDTITTSGEPPGGGDLMTPLLIVAGIGVAGILLIVFVVLPKMKKT